MYAEYSNCWGDKHLTGHMDRNGVQIYSYVCKVQPVLISDDAARRTEAGLKSIIDGQRCIACKYTAKEVKCVATRSKVN